MAEIRLFRSTETNFNHNEWVLNEVISCIVTDGINLDYTLEIEYPLEDSKNISSNLVVGAILSIPSIDGRADQLFRIIDKDTSTTSIIVQAQAKLLADLKENAVRAATLTGLTRKQAITQILNTCLESHSYSVGNLDINTYNGVILNVPEGNPASAIIGDENSVLSEYGGEYRVDNNQLDIVDSIGINNGVVIEYGKNIAAINEKINNTNLATVLIPKSGDYRLPEYYIQSPLVGNYEKRYFKDVEFNFNIWDGTGDKAADQITLSEAYTLMRNACNKMFSVDKVDQISFNYTIDFIQLSQTEEYKNYAILETVNVGDTVIIKHKKLNLNLQGRVNKITYSVNCDGKTTITTVEIGFYRQDLTDIIKTTVKQIKFAQDEIRLALNDSITGVQSEIKLADNKISAVVESPNGGMSWQLSKNAFTVGCTNASGSNTVIDANGLTVNNGKIAVKNSSGETVFKVNTSGNCQVDGGFYANDGFYVSDSDIDVQITSEGLRMTNYHGYSGLLTVDSSRQLYIPDDLRVGMYLRIDEDCLIAGDLNAIGTKNCIQITKNYGKRAISAYETAEYYFGDIGEGIITEGKCIVPIEPIFNECVNTSIPYQVFLQAYNGSITGVIRNVDSFVVTGTDGTTFAWELKAKRLGYEDTRLTEYIENGKVI